MSASSPKMYRAMIPQPSSTSTPLIPAVGTDGNKLGVRVPPHPRADVHPDSSGNVGPIGEGLSVAPSLRKLPQVLVPERLRDKRPGARGSNTLQVFCLGEGAFVRAPVGDSLELFPTSSSHGVIQPIRTTPVEEYQQHLAATQTLWTVDET
ncbi:MAG: hypothetical protein HUU21_25880 [Polyangiaceae bacterium]|nr:hypothetical protein [Polyangiaceae bacterium]